MNQRKIGRRISSKLGSLPRVYCDVVYNNDEDRGAEGDRVDGGGDDGGDGDDDGDGGDGSDGD